MHFYFVVLCGAKQIFILPADLTVMSSRLRAKVCRNNQICYGKGMEEVVNAMPRPLNPRERDPVSTVKEAGWAPLPVWMGVETVAPTGIRSPDRPSSSESLHLLHYPCPQHLLPLPGFDLRTVHHVVWSLHRLRYLSRRRLHLDTTRANTYEHIDCT
jgi:hypothetical protein